MPEWPVKIPDFFQILSQRTLLGSALYCPQPTNIASFRQNLSFNVFGDIESWFLFNNWGRNCVELGKIGLGSKIVKICQKLPLLSFSEPRTAYHI